MLFIFMCVCLRVRQFACTSVCAYVCLCAHLFACTSVNMRAFLWLKKIKCFRTRRALFSRGHATLHLAVSVGTSVRYEFCWIPSNYCITAPAQSSATVLPCIRPCFLSRSQQAYKHKYKHRAGNMKQMECVLGWIEAKRRRKWHTDGKNASSWRERKRVMGLFASASLWV